MLAVIGISGLNKMALSKVRFPFLERCSYTDIASILPAASNTAWMTLWTGQSPSVHGVVEYDAKIDTNILAMHSLWHDMKEAGLKVVRRVKPVVPINANRYDVLLYDLRDNLFSPERSRQANLQASIDEVEKLIERLPACDIVILSAYGYANYSRALNIDRYLFGKRLFVLNDAGMPSLTKSKMIPAGFMLDESRPCWGIHISDWVEPQEAIRLRANVIIDLAKFPGVKAMTREYIADEPGSHLADIPDILVYSPQCKVFIRTAGSRSMNVIESYNAMEPSYRGYMAWTMDSFIDTANIEGLHDALLEFVSAGSTAHITAPAAPVEV